MTVLAILGVGAMATIALLYAIAEPYSGGCVACGATLEDPEDCLCLDCRGGF